jgi:formylglycine-generating enzyme required for sulfatase activity
MELKIDRTTKHVQIFNEDLGDSIKLPMVLIPAGEFLMGSPPTEEGHQARESPQHRVAIGQPFFMGQTPITQAQWRRVAKMPQINCELSLDPARFQRDNLPVESISWLAAQEFCNRLSIHTNRRYRLPSEAEWEYACRAGTTSPFHFGETIDSSIANYQAVDEKIGETLYLGKYGSGKLGEYQHKTTPIRSFGVTNDFGLSDMHGNVWEWCEDDWHDNYKGAPLDGSAWLNSRRKKSDRKILRGGSWLNYPNRCRSAIRYKYVTDNLLDLIGFRVVYAPARTP